MTQAEYDALKSDRPGRSVMVWGKKVIILDSLMSKDNPLYEVFSTNFHEKAEKARKENERGRLWGLILLMKKVNVKSIPQFGSTRKILNPVERNKEKRS